MKTKLYFLAALIAVAGAAGCSTTHVYNPAEERGIASVDSERGSPAMYDPGPEKGSEWAKLFASTPNYRGIADDVLGGSEDKFRWIFGPMWYRGRLGENEVKVFVVGQEGAQDENVTNRAFTGSTGTRLQRFLNSIGVRYSYIFLNTFVYTINGQLDDDPKFQWLAQGDGSPIVAYRHKLFDHVAEMNKDSLALLVGVGAGAKASIATWVNANGGRCSATALESCDTTPVEKKFGLKKKIMIVGVAHPGGANPNNGGTDQLQKVIIPSFQKAFKSVADRVKQDAKWLPVDNETIVSKTPAKRADAFKYGDTPVPFWDFAYGTNWRMGKEGTSSNRQGADSILIFSDDGEYNPPKGQFSYPPLEEPASFSGFTDSGKPIPEMIDYKSADGQTVGDLPYESPKYISGKAGHESMFDYGPCDSTDYSCPLAALLQGQASGYQWPDFKSLGVTEHPSFGTGPIYRGRLKEAKVLILADQMDHDDLFSGRALTGDAGQKLQTFLYALGLTKSYAIVRTLPVDTLDLDDAAREKVILNDDVAKVRNRILDEVIRESGTKVVISFGRFAEKALQQANLKGVDTYNLAETKSKDFVAKWNDVFKQLKGKLRGDVQPLAGFSGKNSTINRNDLPVHTRWWMGTTGNRARRPKNNKTGRIDPNHYLVTAPNWVKKLKPIPAKVKKP